MIDSTCNAAPIVCSSC